MGLPLDRSVNINNNNETQSSYCQLCTAQNFNAQNISNRIATATQNYIISDTHILGGYSLIIIFSKIIGNKLQNWIRLMKDICTSQDLYLLCDWDIRVVAYRGKCFYDWADRQDDPCTSEAPGLDNWSWYLRSMLITTSAHIQDRQVHPSYYPPCMDSNPTNTKDLYNICTMLDRRRRRRDNVVKMLYNFFVFVGKLPTKLSYLIPNNCDLIS